MPAPHAHSRRSSRFGGAAPLTACAICGGGVPARALPLTLTRLEPDAPLVLPMQSKARLKKGPGSANVSRPASRPASRPGTPGSSPEPEPEPEP